MTQQFLQQSIYISARRGFLGSHPINRKGGKKNLKGFVREQNKGAGKRIRDRGEFCFAAVPRESIRGVFYGKKKACEWVGDIKIAGMDA